MRSPLARTVSRDGEIAGEPALSEHAESDAARSAQSPPQRSPLYATLPSPVGHAPIAPSPHLEPRIATDASNARASHPAIEPSLRLDEPEAGARVGPYDLFGVLGRGATSIVYEARHRTLGRRVALKVMQTRGPALLDPARAAARFLREGRAAAAVRHPHVVDVFDAGADGARMYLAMEVIDGPTLAVHLAREGALSHAQAIELLLPVVSAIAELHAAGVVHRDLKPANILLARDTSGEIAPKVADFGLSRLDDDMALTESGAVMGTLAYMAPEQLRGAAHADAFSDQYSLGVVLYECLTRVLPFEGLTLYDRLHAAVTTTPRPPSSIRATLPAALDAIILRALHRDPALRFPSADDFGAALLPFATPDVRARWERELRGDRPSGASSPSQKGRSKRLIAIGTGALFLAILTIALIARARFAAPPVLSNESTPRPAADMPISTSHSVMTAEGATPSVQAPPTIRISPLAAPPVSAPSPRRDARPAKVAPRESGENGAPIIDPD